MMFTAAKWVASVVVGGITLGTLLGDAVNPRMKDPPLQWWQLTGRNTIAANDYLLEDTGPDELNLPGGFRPDLDYDAEVWALAIPGSDIVRYPDYLPDLAPEDSAVEEAQVAAVANVEAVADDAEDAAEQAVEMAEAQPKTVDFRKSDLAVDGLY